MEFAYLNFASSIYNSMDFALFALLLFVYNSMEFAYLNFASSIYNSMDFSLFALLLLFIIPWSLLTLLCFFYL
jgi:hypothetical protein